MNNLLCMKKVYCHEILIMEERNEHLGDVNERRTLIY